MLYRPKAIGNRKLDADTLKKDRKTCRRIGPCGIGREAIYLNSFFLDRRYYVTWTDVQRVYKRVAMSEGGFTGKGVFASIPYLVVELSNGLEQQCNFKREDGVDTFLSIVREEHPEIPTCSRSAQAKLDAARREQESRYLKELTEPARRAVSHLSRIEETLKNARERTDELAEAAKMKRRVDHIRPAGRIGACIFLALGLAMAVYGVYGLITHRNLSAYILLLGLVVCYFVSMTSQLPTRRNRAGYAKKRWDDAVEAMRELTARESDWPMPPQYAHPIVAERMIRVIREGRTDNEAGALEAVKEDLKRLNSDVKVTQQEYDEVVVIKPLFLVCDYRDEL